jgi:hypothetical protein
MYLGFVHVLADFKGADNVDGLGGKKGEGAHEAGGVGIERIHERLDTEEVGLGILLANLVKQKSSACAEVD